MSWPTKEAAALARAKEVRDKLENNVHVTTLPVSIKDLDADIAAWTALIGKKGPGTKEARKAARQKVRNDLDAERGAVQWVVDTVATVADAAAVAESAGMTLKKDAAHPKSVYGVFHTDMPGTVAVTAPASRKHEPHEWQHSTDGQTWETAPSTLKAKTEIAGLALGLPHYFRHRQLTKAGHTEWCDPMVLVVR